MVLNRRIAHIVGWGAVFVAATAQVLFGLRVDSDLGAFMPRAKTTTQESLLKELDIGVASRIWLLVIRGNISANLADASRRFAAELQATGEFDNVFSGQSILDEEAQRIVFKYRYLLDPVGGADQFTTGALRAALEDALQRLRSPVSPFEKQLITVDPTGVARRVVEALQPSAVNVHVRDGAWLSQDETRAFLLAATTASGTDLDAQDRIAARLRSTFDMINGDAEMTLVISGPPAFAVATKRRIEHDALILSTISSVLIIALLWYVYRRLTYALLISIPLAGGLLIAAAITSALWGSVHGISLAFGATLLGVAIDYPVHLVSHARPGESLAAAAPRVWPTLRLGLLTTILGYTAMLMAGFDGIKQLAVFSISGLLAAAVLTRYLLVVAMSGAASGPPRLWALANAVPRFAAKAWWLAPIIVTAALWQAWQDPADVINIRIEELSPVPTELVAQDRDIRISMGLSEPGYVVWVHGGNIEAVLQRQEALRPTLQRAIDTGILRGFEMAANVLPSVHAQRTRRSALPDGAKLEAALELARQDLPFRADTFRAFVTDVERARSLESIDASAFDGTVLGARLDNLVRRDQEGIVGIVTLSGLTQPTKFEALIADLSPAEFGFIDVKSLTNELVAAYRDEILFRSIIALALITVIIIAALRDAHRTLRVLAPVYGAVLTAAALQIALGNPVNLFHLVSLLLVAGLGVDYALFFSRPCNTAIERASTRHSLLICVISTVAVFAILSLSRIPVLSSIGSTVATGAVAAFVLAACMNNVTENAKS